MIQALLSFYFIFEFYRLAKANNKNQLLWGLAGGICFFMSSTIVAQVSVILVDLFFGGTDLAFPLSILATLMGLIFGNWITNKLSYKIGPRFKGHNLKSPNVNKQSFDNKHQVLAKEENNQHEKSEKNNEEENISQIQNKRIFLKQCVMCGQPLGFFEKLLYKYQHSKCSTFKE